MLVFNVIFKCRPGARDGFLEAIRAEGIDAAARAEEGNLQYGFFLPVDDGCRLLLIEKYRDSAAVKEHVRGAHTKRLTELKTEFAVDVILEAFEKPDPA